LEAALGEEAQSEQEINRTELHDRECLKKFRLKDEH
jgi:hypothetical protein